MGLEQEFGIIITFESCDESGSILDQLNLETPYFFQALNQDGLK